MAWGWREIGQWCGLTGVLPARTGPGRARTAARSGVTEVGAALTGARSGVRCREPGLTAV